MQAAERDSNVPNPWSQYMVMWQIVKVVKVGVANFLDQSIGIDGTNTFQLKFFSSIKTVGATGYIHVHIYIFF